MPATKQTAFRLPEKTLDQLDWLVDEKGMQNRTNALVVAIDTYATLAKSGQDPRFADIGMAVKSYLQTDEGKELIRQVCKTNEGEEKVILAKKVQPKRKQKAEPVVIAKSVEKKTFK